MAVPGPHNDLSDVAGVRVGQHQRAGRGWLTGTTVVLPPTGTTGGVDVRGGGPASRETPALDPTTLVSTVDAVCLSGGSAFGLAAANGVADELGRRHVGFRVGPEPHQVVPIVPGAALFDLGAGGRWEHRPDASFGTAALRRAGRGRVRQGSVGAGTGAHAGLLKGGIGSASVILDSGVVIAALVALNSSGDVFDPATGELYGARLGLVGEFAHLRRPRQGEVRAAALAAVAAAAERRATSRPAPATVAAGPVNTALVVIVTDATLTVPECARVASAGHDGLARGIRPAHAMTDGDMAFALATGATPLPVDPKPGPFGIQSARPLQVNVLMAAAADAVTRSVVHAALAATTAGGMLSYRDRFPSAWR